MQIALKVNGESRTVDFDEDTPLLWVLRESLGLTGTKFSCVIAACGACTVHIDGAAARSCSIPAAAVQGLAITTIRVSRRRSGLIRCRQRGSRIRCRNAGTANPA